MRILLLALLAVILFPLLSFADPAIDSITGTVVHGQSIAIYGSDFGTKVPAAPMRWEDFESRADGEYLDSFVTNPWLSLGNRPYVRTTNPYAGTKSGYVIASDVANSYAYFNFPASETEIYSSFQMWTDFEEGATGTPNVKFDRTVSGGYGDAPNRGSTVQVANDFAIGYGQYYQNTGNGIGFGRPPDDGAMYFQKLWEEEAYIRKESYLKLSTVNQSDGHWYESLGLNEWRDSVEMTLASSASATTLNRFLLPFYFGVTGVAVMYYDDVYVDNTRARVEIGDSPVWSSCTKREIQIPTTWSETSVSVTVNVGTFSNNDPAYLFVVNRDGFKSTGFPITIGDTGSSESTIEGQIDVN